MIRFGFFIVILFCVLTACGGRKKAANIDGKNGQFPFIFNMNMVFTDAEKYLSFPLWFNDSLIAKNKVSKMTRSIYYIDIDDTLTMQNLSQEMPREKREYWFHPNGQMKQLKVSYFYDDEEIGHIVYAYSTMKDKNGFATVIKSAENALIAETENSSEDFPFRIHNMVKKTNKYLAYEDVESGDYLFYMLNQKYWGPLSVDSILSPTPKDIVVLGSPKFPTKQYSVQNKVNEKNVVQIEYNTRSKTVKKIIRQDYPFEQKRTILFSKQGLCTGYVDSTFSGNLFLTRTITDFEMDQRKNPIRIIHRKENQNNKTGRITVELFTYE